MVAENLEKIRKSKKYSKTKLAKKAHISARTIEHIEHRKMTNPKIQTLEKLALALEVSLQDLLK